MAKWILESEILWFVENGHEAFFTIEGEAEVVFAVGDGEGETEAGMMAEA